MRVASKRKKMLLLRRLLSLSASLHVLVRGTEIGTQSAALALPDSTQIIAISPILEGASRHHSLRDADESLLSRGEPGFPEDSITVVNPLSWQLSSSYSASPTDGNITDIYNQPKAVISSAFPFLDESNYAPGLRVPPGWSFSVGFHPIFAPRSEGSGNEVSISYSLRLQNGDNLPSWAVWNGEYLTLSGVTPWIGEEERPRQEIYAMRMIATIISSEYDTDHTDTATVAQSFTLVVASHSFECVQESEAPGMLTLNVTKGGERVEQPLIFGGSGGIEGVSLDAQPVREGDIESVRVNVDWASVQPATAASPRTLIIARWKPDRKVLPLTLTNIYGERLDVSINLNFEESIFRYSSRPGWFFNTDLIIGQNFSISLTQNVTRKIEQRGLQQKMLVVEHVPPWMRIRLDPLEVAGAVPQDAKDGTIIGLVFRYTDPETFAVSKVGWNITLVAENKTDDAGGHPINGELADDGRGLSRGAVIAIAVVMSLLGIAVLGCAVFFLLKNRKTRREEKRKWAEILLRDRGAGRSGSFASQPFTSTSIHLQRPQPAYHQDLAPHRPASPSKLKTLLESAITPTKKVRQLALDFKDRSKRYTKSFMSYPIDYLDPTTPPSSCMPIQPPPPPPSPTPFRPVSLVASLAPFAALDPPISGLPSTNFTSDTFLHGRRGSASPASWEDPPSRQDGSSGHPTTDTDNWLHGDLMVLDSEDDRAYNGRPPNLFYAELCHRNSSILRPRDAAPFPASVNSFVDSVRTDERVADAPSVNGG
jgi:hypothetical protein